MDRDVREQFRALRKDTQVLREEMRHDIHRLHAKLDAYAAAVNARCARRGEHLAVLMNREREREARIDRRIALGVLVIALVSLLLRFIP